MTTAKPLFKQGTPVTVSAIGTQVSGVYTRPGRENEAAHMHLVTLVETGQPVWFFADQIAVASYTVQIMANGRWRIDGRNKGIDFGRAQRRIERLQNEGRMGRVIDSVTRRKIAANEYGDLYG